MKTVTLNRLPLLFFNSPHYFYTLTMKSTVKKKALITGSSTSVTRVKEQH